MIYSKRNPRQPQRTSIRASKRGFARGLVAQIHGLARSAGLTAALTVPLRARVLRRAAGPRQPVESYTAAVAGTRNFRSLLLLGTLYTAAIQLTSVSTVLPYMCSELGSPAIIVALLVPAFTVGLLFGSIVAPRIAGATISIARMLALIALLQALLTAANATDIAFLPIGWHAYLLVLSAGLIGVVSGVWSVVFPTAVSSLLTPQQRGDLFLRLSGYGAALVVLVTAYSAGYILGQSAGLEDAELLGIGAASMILAAASAFSLRSGGAVLVGPQRPVGEVLREGYRSLRHERWFRRFVVTNWLFTVVTLGPMFYGICAAQTLGSDNGELDVILIFFSLGLLAGIPLWRQVRKRLDFKGMFVLSGLISASVAVLLILLRASHLLSPVMTFGVVMLLAAVANQPLYVAGQDWLFSHAPEDARTAILAFSQIVLSLGTIVASFGFAMLASHGSAIWPLVVMLCISAVALLAEARVPRRRVVGRSAA